jgi:hypothetical protein
MRVYLDIGTCGREKCFKKSEVLMLSRYSKVSPHCAVTVAVGRYEYSYLYSVHGCWGIESPSWAETPPCGETFAPTYRVEATNARQISP